MGETRFVRAYIDRASLREDGEGPITFVLATEGRKADGLDLAMSGADLQRFESNPVMPWAHDYTRPPIGMWQNVRAEGPKLLGEAVFDREDPFAASIESKYRRGFLNAVSVGFDPRRIEDEEGNVLTGWFAQGKVTDWELLEASGVPIPMDAEALAASGRSAKRVLAHDVLDALGEEGWEAFLQARVSAFLGGRRGGDGVASDDAEWDAQAAISVALAAEDPAAAFGDVSGIATTLGEPSEAQHWALLHHRRPGMAANAAAIRNARARFNQTENLADQEAARRHIFETHELPSETEQAGEPEAVRIGAVLSGRNRDRLEQARGLIAEVLAEAEKPDSTEETQEEAVNYVRGILDALGGTSPARTE